MERAKSPVSDRIREQLAARDISEAGLARYLNLSQSYVSRRMRGDVAWRLDDLSRIAEFFGVPLRELVPDGAEGRAA